MTQRIRTGTCLIILLPFLMSAPATAEQNVRDFALAYRVQVYSTYHGDRDEYNRRMELGEKALKAHRRASSADERASVIDWFSAAIVASYPSNRNYGLPVLPERVERNASPKPAANNDVVADDLKNTIFDAEAIANRADFNFNPNLHPMRFDPYSRSQKRGQHSQSQQIAKVTNPQVLDYPSQTENEAGDASNAVVVAPNAQSESGSNAERKIASADSVPDAEPANVTKSEPIEMAVASIDGNADDDVTKGDGGDEPDEVAMTDSTPEVDAFGSADVTANSDVSEVPAEIDPAGGDKSFEVLVGAEPDEPTDYSDAVILEINARVAGHNLSLGGLNKRVDRAFSGNYKDIPVVVERLEQLLAAHLEIRMLVEQATADSKTRLIPLDNIGHLAIEVNRKLKGFSHHASGMLSRSELNDLRSRVEAVYKATLKL